MTGAPQGACFGRAPPSLRSPPVRSERLINLDGLTERSGHNYDDEVVLDFAFETGVLASDVP